MIAYQYIKDLFEHGLEGYDRSNNQGTNFGGAKFFLKKEWPDKGIGFQKTDFGRALREFNSYCWAFNRGILDKSGNPVRVTRNSSSYQGRSNSGLMLWNPRDTDGSATTKFCARLQEEFPDIADRIVTALDVQRAGLEKQIQLVTKLRKTNWRDQYDNVRIEGCLLICVPSMPEDNSLGYWFNQYLSSRELASRYEADTSTEPIDWDS